MLRRVVRVRAPIRGPGEEVGDARGTPALESTAGGYGAGDFSLGVGWSITSSRRLSVGMTVLLAPPGKASGEVDTLSWKSPTKKQPPDKRHREACPEPPVSTESLRNLRLWLPSPVEARRANPRGAGPFTRAGRAGKGSSCRAAPPGSPRCRVRPAIKRLTVLQPPGPNYPDGLTAPLRGMKIVCTSLGAAGIWVAGDARGRRALVSPLPGTAAAEQGWREEISASAHLPSRSCVPPPY